MKKALLLFALLLFLLPEASAQDAIYFENFESIVFKVKDGQKVLTLNLNNDKGMSKVVIIKQGPDQFVMSRATPESKGTSIVTDEDNIRQVIPSIIKYYLDRYKAKSKDINRIMNKIY